MNISIVSNLLWSVDLVGIISDDFSYSVKLDHRMIDITERSTIISSRVDFSIQPKSERLISKISTASEQKPEQDDEEGRAGRSLFNRSQWYEYITEWS